MLKDILLETFTVEQSRLKTSFLVFIAAYILTLQCFADEVKWLVADWPPYQYQQGDEYLGYSLDTLRVVLKYLPQHQHSFQISNYKRRHSKFKQQDKVCTFGISKSIERQHYMHFSQPAELYFPIQIFMREETYQSLNKPKKASLQTLLIKKQGTLAITPGVVYSAEVDQLVKEKRFSESIFINATKSISKNLYTMLLLKRIDFLLDWPPEGRYGLSLAKVPGKVRSVILEEAKEMSLAYAACPKNKWGRDMVNQINLALIDAHRDEDYTKAYESYLDPYLVSVFRGEFKRRILKARE
jgi:uncharacterized protein (TIGR02285 family)